MDTLPAARTESMALRSLRLGQHALFALLLAIAVFRLVDDGGLPLHGWAAVGLTVAWYMVGGRLARPVPSTRATVWLAVLVALWLALVVVSPEFSWLAFPLFLLTIALLPLTPALVGITLMAAVVVLAQLWAGGSSPVAQIIGPLVGAVVAVGIGLGYQQVLTESRERGQLVAELVAAQDDLDSMQTELAHVQREAGALGERARLARDIHDTLAQGFSSILLLARAGERAAGDPENARLFEQIRDTAADNLAEAREVVGALRPDALAEAPLSAAVGRLLARLEEQTGITTQLRVSGDPTATPTTVEVALLRLVQGALGNVRSHSGASMVVVTLNHGPDSVLLDIVDDGVGFEPDRVTAAPLGGSGFGLRAMTERLAEIGGTLTVESAPGEGTALGVEVPLREVRP